MPSKAARFFTAPRLAWKLAIEPASTAARAAWVAFLLVTIVVPAVTDALGWPWSVAGLLLTLLALSWIALHRANPPGAEVKVTWDGDSTDFVTRLCVENAGQAATFSAKLELLEIRGHYEWRRGRHPTYYKPAWNETSEHEVRILPGDFRYLLLSRMDPVYADDGLRGAQFGFYRHTRGGVEWTADNLWTLDGAFSPWPVFVVRVSLLSDPPAEQPFEKRFEIECLRTGCRLRPLD